MCLSSGKAWWRYAMSRLRKKLPAALLRALIAWLMALGLGMPLLCGAAL